MHESLESLESIIGTKFSDYSLLIRALTHRSYLNENSEQALEDNERLEFLGDAVLDFVVGAYLYNRLPEVDEGELTSLRAALVRANTLASFARQWELGRFLRLGVGESESGGRERTPILCATFEAVIGAIYLDQGLPAVRVLVEKLAGPALVTILDESHHTTRWWRRVVLIMLRCLPCRFWLANRRGVEVKGAANRPQLRRRRGWLWLLPSSTRRKRFEPFADHRRQQLPGPASGFAGAAGA